MKRVSKDHLWTRRFKKFMEYRKLMKPTGENGSLYHTIPGGA